MKLLERKYRRLVLSLNAIAGAALLCLIAEPATAQTLCQEDPTMCQPPSVTFTPATGSSYSGATTTYPLQVTIKWCANSALQASSRQIRFNGTIVTSQFTYTSGASGCSGGVGATSAGTVQLRAGSNTIAGNITNVDGIDGAGTTLYTYQSSGQPPYAVSVTPDGGAQRVADSLPSATVFTVANAGTEPGTYTLAAVCTGTGVSGCGLTRTSVLLPVGETTTIPVTFRAGAVGSTSTVMLKAWKQDASAVRDSGSVAAIVVNEPEIGSVGEAETQSVIARDLCLTASAGDAAAYECGDLRLVHSLPATRILNQSRGPTLLYNSQHASPVPVVAATVSPPAGTTPDAVKALLTVGGVNRANGAWPGWSGGSSRRIALGFLAAGFATGVYDYTLTISTKTGGVESNLTSRTGRFIVVNRKDSPFGRGWWLGGVEQLKPLTGGQLLWIGGDGSAKLYTPTGQPGRWTALALIRPDTLKSDPDATNAGGWLRELPGGARVAFNAAGEHIRTVNQLGFRTDFDWSGGRLQRVTLPRSSAFDTGYEYAFRYDAAGRLTRIVAPYAVTPGDRDVAVRTDALGQVASIQDPDTTSVEFSYHPSYPGLVTRRTDQMRVPTDFTYDSYLRLARVAHDRDSTPGIQTVFTAQETLGRPGAAAMPSANVLTTIDGPRPDAEAIDVTRFRLDRFGSPVQMTNALGHTTTIVRGDERFPGLTTYVRGPTGAEQSAVFDSRGNLIATTDWARRAGVATTTYEWDAKWNTVTRVTSPTGLTTITGFDSSTGQQIWEQVGADTLRRVRFGYYPLDDARAPGLPAWVHSAAAAARGEQPQRIEYDVRGNYAAGISPRGVRDSTYSDRIGRVVETRAPDNPRVRSVYSNSDELRASATIGGGDTLWVEHEYDAAGRTIATHRRVRPDSGGIGTLTLRTRYDRLGRIRAQVDARGAVDSLQYNSAGLVTARITRRRTEQGETVITYSYDALGRLTQKVTPSLLYRRQDFTAFGRDWRFPSRRLNPDDATSDRRIPGEIVTFAYDMLGNIIRADNNDAQVRRRYHRDGSLLADTLRIRTYTGANFGTHVYDLAYDYDVEGRRTRLTIDADVASGLPRRDVTYGYDPQTGALESVQDLAGNTFGFQYDADGRLAGRTMPGSVSAVTSFDADGRVVRQRLERDTLPLAAGGVHILLGDSIVRDDAGRALRGGDDSFEYDRMGALKESLAYGLDGVEQNQIVLNALGNVLRDNRLLVDHLSGAGHPVRTTRTYSYDNAGRQIGMLARNRTTLDIDEEAEWFYDEAGNRWWYQHAARNDEQKTTQERTHSYYDAEDRLIAVDRQRCQTQVASGGYVMGPPLCAQWNEQLRQDASAFEEYRYDAFGRRVFVRRLRYVVNGVCRWSCESSAERIVWDGDQMVAELRARGGDGDDLESDAASGTFHGRVVYTHGAGIDAPLAVHRLGMAGGLLTVVPHANWRGQYEVATFDDGSLVKNGLATASLSLPGAVMNGYMKPILPRQDNNWFGSLITNQRDASGLLSRRNRQYDPETGTFTQEDPIGLAGGLNLYGFGGGDPVNNVDPFGLSSDTVPQGPVLGVGCPAISEHCNSAATIPETDDEILAKGAAYLGAATVGVGIAVAGEAAAARGVWQLGQTTRGFAIEAARGANLPRTFPVIDRFGRGVATSIKSVNLTSRTYQNGSALLSRLNGYTRSLSNFNGSRLARTNVPGDAIRQRVLEVVVPRVAMTAAQRAAFRQAVAYAATRGVTLRIIRF